MAVSLHFKCMIVLVGICRILNNSADRLDEGYVIELEAIGPVQLWTRIYSEFALIHMNVCYFQSFPHFP
jgi:hypothetical protein